jgi:hypothetical protein
MYMVEKGKISLKLRKKKQTLDIVRRTVNNLLLVYNGQIVKVI